MSYKLKLLTYRYLIRNVRQSHIWFLVCFVRLRARRRKKGYKMDIKSQIYTIHNDLEVQYYGFA
jgi:hypothetical protein